jgi:mono/diheme cytochrome c family protein
VVASGTGLAGSAQVPAAPVFTAQQASGGKAAFQKICATCHMPDLSGNNEIPPLAGVTFMGTWDARTTKELLDYMSGAMPPGGPSLPAETYASIAAYILQSNGAVAGPDALNASTAVRIGDLKAVKPVSEGKAPSQ